MKVFIAGIIFIIIHVLFVFVLPSSIPSQNFAYKNLLVKQMSPSWIQPLGNQDGIQYILIAKDGYKEFQQGYFPLFPLLISIVGPFNSDNPLTSGLFISWITFILGIYFLFNVMKIIFQDYKKAWWVIIFLLSFPTGFFFSVNYPESLFLILTYASLFFFLKKRFLISIIFASLSSLTKLQGLFLFIPFFFSLVVFEKFNLKSYLNFFKKRPWLLFLALSPIIGTLIYSTYLYINYHDPLLFYHSQNAFGANRDSSKLIPLPQVMYRYLKILFTANFNYQYLISLFEFITFNIIFFVLAIDLWSLVKKLKNLKNPGRENMVFLSLNIYSFAVIILPTLTGTLTSFPRYALLAIGFFIALAKIDNIFIKLIICVVFSIIQLFLYTYFLKGYFVS